MITIKNKSSIAKMETAGRLLSTIFAGLPTLMRPGITTLEIDTWIEQQQRLSGLVSKMKGYKGYKHVSCISVNDVIVHGVPTNTKVLHEGDLVKVDVCASWNSYCADMARVFVVGSIDAEKQRLVDVAYRALDKGISKAHAGNRLTDISAAIQQEIEAAGFGVVRDFAGHGIGKQMHEDPEILNYGKPGRGPLLRVGMAFALEPMITVGSYDVVIMPDGWTAKTADGGCAVHVEDTIVITESGPKILTRYTA
jgi:methionyl aminopeptidase